MAAETQKTTYELTPARRLIIAAFVVDFAVSIVGLTVQFKGVALNATPLQLGLLGTFGSLAYTIGCLFSGTMSDRLGRRLLAAVSCFGCGIVWLGMTQAGSPAQLLALVPFSGGSLSLFWPPVQAWLSQVSATPARLTRNIGSFNLSWTIGLMLGPPAAGILWGFGEAVPFLFAAGVILALMVWTRTIKGGGRSECELAPSAAEGPPMDAKLAQQFLHLAWVANFAAWFGRGVIGVVFPKLASDLQMSEQIIGVIIATLLAGQLAMFVYLRRHTGWQYRLWPLLVGLGCGAVGMTIAYFARTPWVFIAGFVTAGMGGGITYSASLYYSLQGHEESRGARSGLHEAVLGSGIFLGPLVGGAVANYVNLHVPFLVGAGMSAVLAVVLVAMWWRTVRARRRELRAEVEVNSK